ncbi:hypothetical protein ACG7TL_004399 [Trametes sanguinea]
MDPQSILACREASPQLKETIDDSIEVHYHLELALSGMLDGPRPPGSACTRDRLAALRAYRAAWDAGKHPTQRVIIDLGKQKLHSESARHIVYHASHARRHGGSRRLTVYRPPASFCGIEERKVDFECVYELAGDRPYSIMGYVDVQEDMLAYIWDDHDSRLLAVLDHRTKKPSLHVFSFDPSALANAGCSTIQDCTCTLALPIRGVEPRFKMTVTQSDDNIARPPSYRYAAPGLNTASAPLFLRDPDLTPLVVRYSGGISLRKREYLLIIPPDTLNKWYKEKPTQRPVPWEQWGPQGTRMIPLPELELPWPEPMWAECFGSCVAVYQRKEYDGRHAVKLYEVHPNAFLRPPSLGDAGKAKPPRRPLWMPAENKIRTPKLTRKKPPINLGDPLSTSYPVRKTFTVVPREWYEGRNAQVGRSELAMGHDNIVVYQLFLARHLSFSLGSRHHNWYRLLLPVLAKGSTQVYHMAGSRILELPAELQVRILSKLDARSILACRQASPELAQTIDNAVELRYQLELALAGMIDGPPGPASIRDRLDALRRYRAAWYAGRHPVHKITIAPVEPWHTHTGALTSYIEATTGRLKIYRPVGTLCGLAALDATFDGLEAEIATYPDLCSYTTDPSQDLLVYSWDTHPAAGGDLVALTVNCDDACPVDMMVVNWKTGIIVWHMHGTPDHHLLLLSNTHALVVNSSMPSYDDECFLQIYDFDPTTPINVPLATEDGCLYALAPPSCADRGELPFFSHDPELLLLVLSITIFFWEEGHPESYLDSESYLLLVPLETLLRSTTGSKIPRGSVVPWDDWGPQGTRMLHVEKHVQGVSPLGSRVSLHNWWSAEEPCVVIIYELNKYANESICAGPDDGEDDNDNSKDARMAAAAASGIVLADDDWITNSKAWKNPEILLEGTKRPEDCLVITVAPRPDLAKTRTKRPRGKMLFDYA